MPIGPAAVPVAVARERVSKGFRWAAVLQQQAHRYGRIRGMDLDRCRDGTAAFPHNVSHSSLTLRRFAEGRACNVCSTASKPRRTARVHSDYVGHTGACPQALEDGRLKAIAVPAVLDMKSEAPRAPARRTDTQQVKHSALNVVLADG
jgi:hypothetical protein